MKLMGERIELRPIEPDDFYFLVRWTNDPEINRFSEGNYPKTLAECPAWFKRARSNRYQERFMIVLASQPIGDLELDHITWRSGDAELRIRIGEKEFWDQGYGTEAVLLLLQHAFLSMGLNRIYLRVYADNRRALRCYQKAGFRKEGRLRWEDKTDSYRELILMRILREEYLRRAV